MHSVSGLDTGFLHRRTCLALVGVESQYKSDYKSIHTLNPAPPFCIQRSRPRQNRLLRAQGAVTWDPPTGTCWGCTRVRTKHKTLRPHRTCLVVRTQHACLCASHAPNERSWSDACTTAGGKIYCCLRIPIASPTRPNLLRGRSPDSASLITPWYQFQCRPLRNRTISAPLRAISAPVRPPIGSKITISAPAHAPWN